MSTAAGAAGTGAARETVFTFDAPPVVFGEGAAGEVDFHVARLGVTRALLVCDPHVTASGLAARLTGALSARGIAAEVFDRIVGEPGEESARDAIAAARAGAYDGFVGVGGGSALDTAKLCALFATHGGELLDYVNKPIGEGRQVPGPVLPLVAVPTTAGTGSEVTSVIVLDFPRLGVKTGISHRYLRPRVAIVDPELSLSCPRGVTAAAGLDALAHALEAYTARPYGARAHAAPEERPPYQGAGPLTEALCAQAIQLVGRSLRRAVADGSDREARRELALAATTAGIGFGNAGVHVPHALAYPIASLKHAWAPPGYPVGSLFVPHGLAVAVTSPAAYRALADAAPERCREAARLLDGSDDLAAAFARLMADVGAPATLGELGYDAGDVPAIVEGALKQQRLLVIAPRAVDAADLEAIVRASL
jgi:alcohol dehydrogenase class IV